MFVNVVGGDYGDYVRDVEAIAMEQRIKLSEVRNIWRVYVLPKPNAALLL